MKRLLDYRLMKVLCSLLIMVMVLSIVGCKQEEVVQEAVVDHDSIVTDSTEPDSTEPVALEPITFELDESRWLDYATLYEVNVRQYTKEGTFNAFAEHLPRLQELGVKILWFMPIHPISEVNRKGTLGSYYAVADYKGVNPEFGTPEDFKNLVDLSHEMGFKVILDWVPNHTGWDHPWIFEHPEWYTQVDGQIIHPSGTDWTDVADLNYDNEEMRMAMTDAMTYWVEEFDVDGYRCDVAGSVPLDFWNQVSETLNSIKPLFMLAEDGSNYELLETAFDANYSWNFMNSMNDIGKGNGSVSALAGDMVRGIALYPEGTFPLNFVTNHDENSWNGTVDERLGDAKDALTALTFVAPGMPLIYSGQEASLSKRLLFFEKDEIDWTDLSYQSFFEDLVTLKLYNPALYNGAAGGEFLSIKTDEKSILVFIRKKDQNRVVYMANFSEDTVTFKLKKMDDHGDYLDYQSEETVRLEEDASFELEPYGFRIFVGN